MNEYESESAHARLLTAFVSVAGSRSDRDVLPFHRDILISQTHEEIKLTLFATCLGEVLFRDANLNFTA